MIELLKLKEQLQKDIRDITVSYDISEGKEKLNFEGLLLEKKMELNKLRKNSKVSSKAISALDLISEVSNRPIVPRYETGVPALDRVLNGGIEIGSFVQLAGASFAGKTHLAIEILSKVATYNRVLFFNFEMGDRRIAARFNKTLHTIESKKNMMIHNDNRELSHIVDEINSGIKQGINFFAIDSKMKIEVSHIKEDHKKFSLISATFSKLTQENEIIIFLINQISEDDDKTERLAFKGSGDQLYDTDIALFYQLDKKDASARKLICRKNRQDENNFTLFLRLDDNGNTIENHNVQTVHQDNTGRYVAPMTKQYNVKETEYKHDMATI